MLRRVRRISLSTLATVACTSFGVAATAAENEVGNLLVAPSSAGRLFVQACVHTRPDFAKTQDVMNAIGFVPHPKTGTYFDGKHNLSFKVHNGQCSLVFGTLQDTEEVVSELAEGAMSVEAQLPGNISITSNPGPDGIRYFRLSIPGN